MKKIAAILGGGESLPDDLALVPDEATLIGVNWHASRLVDCDYIAFLDQHTLDFVKHLPGQTVSIHEGADIIMTLPPPGAAWGNSGRFAVWFADQQGFDEIWICGVDCYMTKYFHGVPVNIPTGATIAQRVDGWRRCFTECDHPERIRAVSGPLVELFGSIDIGPQDELLSMAAG